LVRTAIVLAIVMVAAWADADPAGQFAEATRLEQAGQLEAAGDAFLRIATTYPKSAEARPAAERALAIAGQAGNYAKLWELTNVFAKHPAFAATDQQQRLAAIRFQASSKLGDVEASAGRFAKAAERYVRAAGETPQPRDAAQAMTNAAVMFEKARQADRAIEAYRAVADRWPTERTAPTALFAVAHIEQAVLRWERAADAYDRLAVKYPAEAVAADALYNSGILHASLGDTDRAIASLDRYVRAYRTRADVPATALLAAKLREDKGDLPGAFAAYVAVAGMPGERAIEARLGAGRVAFKLGRDRDAETHLAAAIDLAKRNPKSRRMRAEARLWQGRVVARKADAISIDVARPSVAIKAKRRGWDDAERLFLDAVDGDPTIGITALREAGANRERLVQEVQARPQLKQFVAELQTRAIDFYRAAYAECTQLAIYSDDTIAIHDALVRLGAVPADPFVHAPTGRSDAPAPTLSTIERR
jgi:tetratricopeptide (TPR) repeat protein